MTEEPRRQILIETDRLILRRVTPEEGRLILDFEEPEGLNFADGYPGEFSQEVMDLFVGDRADETRNFDPWFIIRKEQKDVIGGASLRDGSPLISRDLGWSYAG